MQIIDFEKKGNVVRFYLGDATKPYWGDDWYDRPYNTNASRVYDKFIKGHRDIAFPFDDLVLEPCDGSFFSDNVSKEDMVKRKVPCLIVVPCNGTPRWNGNSQSWVGAGDTMQTYYFGDELEPEAEANEDESTDDRTGATNPQTNLEWLEQEGIDYKDIDATGFGNDDWIVISPYKGPLGTIRGSSSKLKAVLDWFSSEHTTAAVLTSEETAYLESVIKPFRSSVVYIEKTKAHSDTEYIYITFKGDCDMEFPCFPTGSKYKGLTADVPYTLTELGL